MNGSLRLGTQAAEKKRPLILISPRQFGHHTGIYKIAYYLRTKFEVVVVCFDNKLPKVDLTGVSVCYVNYGGGSLVRLIRLIRAAIASIRNGRCGHALLMYFPLCSLVPLLSRKDVILDFRTGSVDSRRFVRYFRDRCATFESHFFSKVSVISEGLRRSLRISAKKSFILPLGADIIATGDRVFDSPRLLYIGTFFNRNLHQTIRGVSIALATRPGLRTCMSFDVVGYGSPDEVHRLDDLIIREGLQDIVTLYGRVPYSEAKKFFEKANIGISYIPITNYYQHQPPTKTYEYILSGMPAIATATAENIRLISDENGIVCDDNPGSFAAALIECVDRFPSYRSTAIRSTLANCRWSIIASDFERQLDNG